jgi:hypothetical protein
MGRTLLNSESGTFPSNAKKKWDRIQKYMVIDDKVVETKKVVVHRFTMGDVEDPDLYAAEPLWNWQQSEEGKWVMENAMDTPEWRRQPDPITWGHSYAIVAIFELKKLTEFYLRFGKTDR